VRGRLAVGDDQQHRLRSRVLAEVPVGQEQGVVQVGALVPHRVERGELLDLHHLGMAAEADQLQRVASGSEIWTKRGAAPSRCASSAPSGRPSAIENDGVDSMRDRRSEVRASLS
jgi:hypothetical protein